MTQGPKKVKQPHLRFKASALMLWVCLAIAFCSNNTSLAQQVAVSVADGFETPELDLTIWNPLQIEPDRYRIDDAYYRSGHGALAISVRTLDRACGGNCQRNELRIANHLRLNFGEEAWYGFSFQVRGNIAPNTLRRWVIAQWKEESDGSPFLAQRYSGGIFHITAQQNECRILVARSGSTADEFLSTLEARDYGAFPFVTDIRDYDCTPDVTIEFADDPILPDPYGTWVDMVYYVRGGREGDGMVEVWANGRFVARLKGSIGNDDPFGPTQYFKIGMYRDMSPGNATLYVDNFRRGRSREEVDPSIGVER